MGIFLKTKFGNMLYYQVKKLGNIIYAYVDENDANYIFVNINHFYGDETKAFQRLKELCEFYNKDIYNYDYLRN